MVVMGGLAVVVETVQEEGKPHKLDQPFANNSAAVAVVGQRVVAVAVVLDQVPAHTPVAAQAATLGEEQRARSSVQTAKLDGQQAVKKAWAKAYPPETSRGATGRWIVGMVAGVGGETQEEGMLLPV